MLKLDHLRLPVTDLVRSRDWYVGTLGLAVESVELQDPDGYLVRLWDERSMRER